MGQGRKVVADESKGQMLGPESRLATVDAAASPAPRPWSVYLLRCGDGSLYAGIARDVDKRFRTHVDGKGARYTRGRGPLTLVYVEAVASHGEALRREAALRRLRRPQKEQLLLIWAEPRPAPPQG